MWTNVGGAVGSDSSIAKLLRSRPDINENVIRNMCSNLTYADLAALTEADLILFGITEKDTRQQLLEEFSALTNQKKSLNKSLEAIRGIDSPVQIYCCVQNQLTAIALVLESAELINRNDLNNSLMKPDIHASTILLRALESFSVNSHVMRIMKRRTQFKWICCGALLVLLSAARNRL